MRKTELLIPAGSLDVLKTAVIYGADAVYLGGEAFGLRAKAKNFTNEEIMEGIKFAHDHGVKVYITANILAHNDDLPGVEAYFEDDPSGRADHLGSGCLYDRKESSPGYGDPYQHTGEQYKLWNLPFLA